MRIKRLDIMGFKSFPERAQILFPAGISAVVGPNGCGKSNIVDAIRWVMGEQSAKQLRGRNMDDVIFNGAHSFQASGMAEVTLTMCNDSPHGPGPTVGPSEISVTRRLYRSGDSEYLINKVPCRLKDISQFFMDTGMGTKAYAIIEQGRIGAMVDSRPEERRGLIDEAAGITRYKAQKKEAERKIEATEQNLVHIETLMSEAKRQINTLTRAAQKAGRYKTLKSELKDIDLALTWVEMSGLDGRRAELSDRQKELADELQGLLTELDRLEVELEGVKLGIVEQEKAAEAKAAALYTLQNEYNTLHQEDEFLFKQSEENRSRQSRYSGELENLAAQKERQEQELARLREETVRLRAEAESKAGVREDLRSGLDEQRQEYDEVCSRRDGLAAELSRLRARLGRLEEVAASHERMAESQSARREEIGEEIAQLRSESARLNEQFRLRNGEREDFAAGVEEARGLAAARRAELAEKKAEADRLGEEERALESRLAGMASRLSTLKDVQANFGWYPEGVQALMNSPEMAKAGVLCPVAERISAPSGYEAAVEAALGERLNFILVKDRNAAAAALDFLRANNLGRCGFIALAELETRDDGDLARSLIGDYALAEDAARAAASGPGRTVLTRDGSYFGQGGLIIGGRAGDEDKGLLARRREIEELAGQVETLEAGLESISMSRDAVLAEAGVLAGTVEEAEEMARVAASGLVEVEKALSSINSRREDAQGRLAALSRQLEAQTAEAEKIDAQREAALAEQQSLSDDEFDLARDLEEMTERVKGLAAQVEASRERERQASLEASSLNERLKTAEREIQRTSEWLRETRERSEAKKKDLAEAVAELEKLAGRRREVAAALDGFSDRLVKAEEELAEQKRRVDEMRSDLNSRENGARQSRRRRSELDEQARKVDLDIQEIGFKRKAYLERIENEYRLDLTALPEEEKPRVGDDFDSGEARKRRQDLRERIEGMGEVNLTAIGEHEALTERYDFYRQQHDDLKSSIENLRQSIARINRTCKIRFTNTFKAVDEKIREIFPLLFDGGEAWLSLTDESDILDSGVEIHVHPPGKKLTVMSLLSGGEKALVALAFIFALYLIKPSPFCLLDEIDAPLDEANIDRFNRLLKKLGQASQIVMITHNKRTMQISDTLYGVTMEKPGISKMVSVNLSDIEVLEQDAKMVQAG